MTNRIYKSNYVRPDSVQLRREFVEYMSQQGGRGAIPKALFDVGRVALSPAVVDLLAERDVRAEDDDLNEVILAIMPQVSQLVFRHARGDWEPGRLADSNAKAAASGSGAILSAFTSIVDGTEHTVCLMTDLDDGGTVICTEEEAKNKSLPSLTDILSGETVAVHIVDAPAPDREQSLEDRVRSNLIRDHFGSERSLSHAEIALSGAKIVHEIVAKMLEDENVPEQVREGLKHATDWRCVEHLGDGFRFNPGMLSMSDELLRHFKKLVRRTLKEHEQDSDNEELIDEGVAHLVMIMLKRHACGEEWSKIGDEMRDRNEQSLERGEGFVVSALCAGDEPILVISNLQSMITVASTLRESSEHIAARRAKQN